MGNKSYQEDLWDSTESELYGYDAVYRLTGFERGQLNQEKTDITNPTRSQAWTLDPLGNWGSTVLDSVTESRVHNEVNELTSRTVGQNPAINLTYDNAGNLTQDGSNDGDHQYVWDYRNRLKQVKERQSGQWVTVADYKFDALNRRVRRSVSNKGSLNGVTRFVYGGDSDWQCLEERAGGDALVARYTYAPGYIDAVAVQERDLNADGDFGDANEVVYYHSNTLFSVYCLTDSSEAVLERYLYDAYGGATVLEADGSDDSDGWSDVGNPYLFTGRSVDRETGTGGPSTCLMHYRNRAYSTTLGRFVSRDPVYVDVYNLYGYGESAPSRRSDPGGLSSVLPPTECPSGRWKGSGGGFYKYNPILESNSFLTMTVGELRCEDEQEFMTIDAWCCPFHLNSARVKLARTKVYIRRIIQGAGYMASGAAKGIGGSGISTNVTVAVASGSVRVSGVRTAAEVLALKESGQVWSGSVGPIVEAGAVSVIGGRITASATTAGLGLGVSLPLPGSMTQAMTGGKPMWTTRPDPGLNWARLCAECGRESPVAFIVTVPHYKYGLETIADNICLQKIGPPFHFIPK